MILYLNEVSRLTRDQNNATRGNIRLLSIKFSIDWGI